MDEKSLIHTDDLKEYDKFLKSNLNSLNLEKMENELLTLLHFFTLDEEDVPNTMLVQQISVYLTNNERFLYNTITKFIEKISTIERNNLLQRIDILYKSKEFRSLDEDMKFKYIKLYDHVNLAFFQWSQYLDSDTKIRNLTQTEMRKFHDEINVLSNKNMESIENKVSASLEAINTQLISIVSIFVAISFVMFGGMSLLNNLFDYSRLERIPLIEMLCGGSLIGLIIVAVMYGFILLVLKLTKHETRVGNNARYSCVVNLTTIILAVILVGTFFLWFDNFHSLNDISNSAKSYQTQCKTVEYNKKTKEVTLVCPADITDTKEQKQN